MIKKIGMQGNHKGSCEPGCSTQSQRRACQVAFPISYGEGHLARAETLLEDTLVNTTLQGQEL